MANVNVNLRKIQMEFWSFICWFIVLFSILSLRQQEWIHAILHHSLADAATSVYWPLGKCLVQMAIQDLRIQTVFLVTVRRAFICFMIRGPAIQQVPVGFVDVLPTSLVYIHSLFPWWSFSLCVPLLYPSLLSNVVGIRIKYIGFLTPNANLHKEVCETSVFKCDRVAHSLNYIN